MPVAVPSTAHIPAHQLRHRLEVGAGDDRYEAQMTRLEEEIQRYKKLELGLYENFVEGIINKAFAFCVLRIMAPSQSPQNR